MVYHGVSSASGIFFTVLDPVGRRRRRRLIDDMHTLITSLSTGYGSIPVEHLVTHIRQDCFHPTKTTRRAMKIDDLSSSPPLPLKPRDACACGNGDDAVGLDKGRWPT
ncbi:hypothetical protein ALC53_02250 [Atta colombica]|uniref:Uncharacterized protein n=1 Tax=Atta colombica TaxID=520822 RepID=A0A195BTD4_9HYME|nr:hypothetical protein ALC53_02250 [Atta colombica]